MAVIFIGFNGYAQRRQEFIDPMPARTAETDAEALRLMRNEKLDLILPGAMRDNKLEKILGPKYSPRIVSAETRAEDK